MNTTELASAIATMLDGNGYDEEFDCWWSAWHEGTHVFIEIEFGGDAANRTYRLTIEDSSGLCEHDVPWKEMPYSHYSMYHKVDHP